MKLPGPDHPITIEPNPKRVRVMLNGRVIAETTMDPRHRTLRAVDSRLLRPASKATSTDFTRHGTPSDSHRSRTNASSASESEPRSWWLTCATVSERSHA